MLLKFQVPELYFYRTKCGKNRKTTFLVPTVRDCKADEGLSQHPVRRRKTVMCENKPLLNVSSHDPRQGVAKGCYCRSVGAIHQGSPLILDFKAAFKE